MKKVLIAVAAIAALPATAQAQDVQMPGVYFGVEGGLNWMFNTWDPLESTCRHASLSIL